ncbi:RAxF-45 family protein [Falsibacillus albus]|nr:RAxF-45 family protein [Falsibacillus albus]
MERSVGLHGQFLEFIYICRAIFHVEFAKGTSMPFFKQFHMDDRTVKIS